MNFVKSTSLFIALAFLAGCSGMTSTGYKIADDKFVVQRAVSSSHAFSPTVQRSWMEVCKEKVKDEYNDCTPTGDVQFAITNGYLDGLGGSALQAGAIVGAAALIGSGIAKSGARNNTTNNTNTSLDSGTQTQTQTQTSTNTNTNGNTSNGGGNNGNNGGGHHNNND